MLAAPSHGPRARRTTDWWRARPRGPTPAPRREPGHRSPRSGPARPRGRPARRRRPRHGRSRPDRGTGRSLAPRRAGDRQRTAAPSVGRRPATARDRAGREPGASTGASTCRSSTRAPKTAGKVRRSARRLAPMLRSAASSRAARRGSAPIRSATSSSSAASSGLRSRRRRRAASTAPSTPAASRPAPTSPAKLSTTEPDAASVPAASTSLVVSVSPAGSGVSSDAADPPKASAPSSVADGPGSPVGTAATAGSAARAIDPLHPGGVLRHDQQPMGVDQPRERELRAIGLAPVPVQLEDLPVATPVLQGALGDVPEVVVIPALRWLDHVDPLAEKGATLVRRELDVAEPVALLVHGARRRCLCGCLSRLRRLRRGGRLRGHPCRDCDRSRVAARKLARCQRRGLTGDHDEQHR